MNNDITLLEKKAVEESTYSIVIGFKDSAGSDVVPNTLKWTLSDKSGTIINSRTEVPVVTPAASITVVLSGDDLAIPDADDAMRFFLIEGDYDDPDLGSGLPLRDECAFLIKKTVN